MTQLDLYCDASFKDQSQAAGWGAWAKRPDWDDALTFGGGFTYKLPASSREAELAAISTAVCHLRARALLFDIALLGIHCDCLRSLGLIAARIHGTTVLDDGNASPVAPLHNDRLSDTDRHSLKVLREFVGTTGILLVLTHVKGHAAVPDEHQAINDTCHAIAISKMRRVDRRYGGRRAA